MEEAFVPIEGADTNHQGRCAKSLRSDRDLGQTPTRQGDPIAKTLTKHQEGGGRAFVPIED